MAHLHLEPSKLADRFSSDEIRYSTVWEDVNCLFQAADSAVSAANVKRILSIGSAGDNALSLLRYNPEKLVIIDLSPAQIHLVELKILAFKHLTFDEYLALFGVIESEFRNELVDRLSLYMTDKAREYWLRNYHLLRAGLNNQGRLEKYFKKFRDSVWPRIWSTELLDKMINEPQTSIEQMNYFMQGDHELLIKAVTEFFSKSPLSREGRDEIQFRHVKPENIGPLFMRRFLNLMQTQLISKNPYLYFFFTGRQLLTEGAVPTLTAADFDMIRSRLACIEIAHSDLEKYLNASDIQFDFMNLSDIFEYQSDDEADLLFESISKRLSPSGAMAYWTLLFDRKPKGALKIDDRISNLINSSDRTWFYSQFHVARKF